MKKLQMLSLALVCASVAMLYISFLTTCIFLAACSSLFFIFSKNETVKNILTSINNSFFKLLSASTHIIGKAFFDFVKKSTTNFLQNPMYLIVLAVALYFIVLSKIITLVFIAAIVVAAFKEALQENPDQQTAAQSGSPFAIYTAYILASILLASGYVPAMLIQVAIILVNIFFIYIDPPTAEKDKVTYNLDDKVVNAQTLAQIATVAQTVANGDHLATKQEKETTPTSSWFTALFGNS